MSSPSHIQEDDELRQPKSPLDEETDKPKMDSIESPPAKSTPKSRQSTTRSGRTIKIKSPADAMADLKKTPKINKDESVGSCDLERTLESANDSELSVDNVNNSFINEMDAAKHEDKTAIVEVPRLVCPWVLGQMVWSRIGNFPFWPSVITLDPDKMVYYIGRGSGRLVSVHVRYCADRGRHSWVPTNNIMPFCGLEEFKKRADSITPDMKKKEAKFAAAFFIKSNLKLKWDEAVAEAMSLMREPIEKRVERFQPEKQNGKENKTPKAENLDDAAMKKRKRKSQGGETSPKKIKQEGEASDDEIDEESPDVVSSLRIDGPPTPPSSHKDSSDEAPRARVYKKRKPANREEGDFEIYFDRNRHIAEFEDPDATEQDIRKFLKKLWRELSQEQRRRYRQDYTVEDVKSIASDVESEQSAESEVVEKPPRRRRSKVEKEDSPARPSVPLSPIVENGKKGRPYNPFKGMKQERVCQICEETGKLTRCKGPCYSYFHLSCVRPGESSPEPSEAGDLDEVDVKKIPNLETNEKDEESTEDENFKCIDCLSGVAPACFVCNEREGERQKCAVIACGKHYHMTCLKTWPQSHWQGGRLTCPYHTCHTCSSDNPQNQHSRTSNEKTARCVRCPSAYHASVSCIPAGSVILTGSQLICPKHYKASHPPLNATWCFLCTEGGSLICCDTCPTSFHITCLGIDAPEGGFICEDCETGRLPLYGEIVWVKLGNYRWWPSIICYPHEIPRNVSATPHKPGEFCVMFLGTRNFHWVHRGRAFLFQEGDTSAKVSSGKKVEESYKKAIEEAQILYERNKIEKAAAKDNGSRLMKPPPYVRIKVNKPVGNVKMPEGESMLACNCNPKDDEPCGMDSDCLNRALSNECSPDICPAGSKCKNQDFVHRNYPAMKPFYADDRGWGLQSLEPIQSGQFIIEYVGEVIDEAEYKSRVQQKKECKNENYYFLTIDNCRMIDAEPKGNLSRFMNHSCQPNCKTEKWTVNGDTRIGLFALQDIEPGEELTFNYNLAVDGETHKPCLCGAPNCSGFIGLKVQKTNGVQETKPEKVKRQRRGRKAMCWNCREKINNPQEVIRCEQKSCCKLYHPHCISIDEGPTNLKFNCPWHFCAECEKRTTLHCSFCCNAFCQAHIESNLWDVGKGNFACYSHVNDPTLVSPSDIKDFDSSAIETQADEEEEESQETSAGSEDSSNTDTAKESNLNESVSSRGCIVEVRMSSEEDSFREDEGDNADTSTETLKSSTPKKESQTKRQDSKSFTFDQIEDIIGGSL